MQDSNIAWCDKTWNPTHGCSKVSAGCGLAEDGGEVGAGCYAETISRMHSHTDEPWTAENAAENVTLQQHKLEEPYDIDEPARVFFNSMSDLFHAEVPDDYIEDVFAVMRNCPHIIFQILTKRPGRAAHMALEWPPNVWMGTSVEDDRVTERLDLLRSCDSDVLFVSFEPLIGPVGDVDLSGYEWAIVGGESGDGYRDMEHAWARSIREQCRRDDVRFFFKQSAGRHPETGTDLTVEHETHGMFVQKTIRELPDPHLAVRDARAHLEVDL